MNNTQTHSNDPKPKNTIGIISLVLSIIAIAGSWIPILNLISMVLAIIGICLGLWSFINVLRKKVSGVALPILSVILGFLSISLSSNMNNHVFSDSTDSTVSKVSTTSENSTAEDTKSEYNVGDVIAFDGKEFTVTKVQKNFSIKYSEPKSGYEFIKLDVKIENKSDSNISVNTYNFKMQDSNGAIEDVSMETYSADDGFESAELIPNGKRSGSIIFEVPKNDTNLKLIYEPSFWSNKKVMIKI